MKSISLLKNSTLLSCRVFHSVIVRSLQTMQAWQAFEYGGPEQLQLNPSAEIPIVKNCSDVLVRVQASSVNPLDVRMLEGYGSATFNVARQINSCSLTSKDFPLTLGRDFSGTVAHVGKGVKSLRVGDEVWGTLNPWESGSHAEYVLASSCHISKKPASLGHTEAASLPYAGLTAWAALCTFGGLSERNAHRKRVLVIGSSGGVGTFATQLLKTWGAEVTVVCASDCEDKMKDLGAISVLDYSSPDFKDNIKSLSGFDLIFDNVGAHYPDLTLNLLKPWKNSKYVTVVSPLLKNADDRGVVFGALLSAAQAGFDTAMSLKDGKSFRWAYFIPNGCALKTIATMVDRKQIVPVINKVYNFEDLPEALARMSQGHARGKTVVDYAPMDASSENKTQEKNV